MLNTLRQWAWGSPASTAPDTTHHVGAPVTTDSIYASVQKDLTASADMHTPPIHLAALSGEENPIEKALLMLPTQSPLHALIETRDTLIQKLRASENYHPTFERLINKLVRLGDESLDSGKASRYTERVNTILQAILDHPTFHTYCMRVGVEGEKESSRTQDDHFIHSQVIKTLLFLEFASLCECPQPQIHYQDLIELGKQTQTWISLIDYIHTHPYQKQMPKGLSCQLDVSILYAAQAHLTLPFQIESLDDLVEVPSEILAQALVAAKAKTEDPLLLYQALYTLPFWKTYIRKGYLDDSTVKDTRLEQACLLIEATYKANVNKGRWCKTYPQDTPEKARENAIFFVFLQGLEETMAKNVK